jgi:hypothetical protein
MMWQRDEESRKIDRETQRDERRAYKEREDAYRREKDEREAVYRRERDAREDRKDREFQLLLAAILSGKVVSANDNSNST